MSTVLVTGSSRGIGRAIARKFYSEGYNLVINYNRRDDLVDDLEREVPGALIVKADISSEEDVERLFRAAEERFLGIDVLVNNAGISESGLFIDKDRNDYDRIVGINVYGMLNCTKQALKLMLRKKKGSIVNISSIWGDKGASCESLYSLTKGAVNAFTRSIAKEYAEENIRVNAVMPGFIDTEMNSGYTADERKALEDAIPLGRAGTPEEVADLVYFLAGDQASYITGQLIYCDGGWSVE